MSRGNGQPPPIRDPRVLGPLETVHGGFGLPDDHVRVLVRPPTTAAQRMVNRLCGGGHLAPNRWGSCPRCGTQIATAVG